MPVSKRSAKKKQAGRARRQPRYSGVTPTGRGTFEVRVTLPHGRQRFIGTWSSERDAAIVMDRVVLHLGLEHPLNLPRVSRKLGPLSPEQARQLPRSVTRSHSGRPGVGVFKAARGWQIKAIVAGRLVCASGFRTARQAALARDRLVLGAERTPMLNFPHADLEPASIDDLRRELRESTSGKLLGVKHWKSRKLKRPWGAVVRVKGRALTLGTWPTRKAAAEAYDRAARYYGMGPEHLNFPKRRLRPADAASLRLEAKKHRKFSSRYRGVTWSKAAQCWIAVVHGTVKGRTIAQYVGSFASERQAAKARDVEARRLLGRSAELNFDPKTGRARPRFG